MIKQLKAVHVFTWLLFGIVFLTSCAMAPPMKDVEAPIAGETIVFGQVDVFENGVKQDWKMKWTGARTFYLMILPPGTTEAITYKVMEDGSFYWSLKPGEYQLLAYRFQKGNQWLTGRIGATFSVPANVDGLYVGDFRMNIQRGRYFTSIANNFKSALINYQNKFPTQTSAPQASLMKGRKKLGQYNLVGHPCHKMWGITCTKRYRGVEPISPEIANHGFPQTESLSPVFKWKPSSSSDITYDFVIYEAASYSVSGMDKQYVEGRLVDYWENVKQPYLTLLSPLKPATRYFWSVRTRKGQTVSGWSSFSFMGFYVFAMTSGVGKPFAFSTPPSP
ncbi:MAG: hypothetical protein P8Y24_02445 [Gammaproteobacteria bacterium]|jgi:hypothetical protein